MDILIVSGFLGAGKTTFILEFVRQYEKKDKKKIAVIVNEFGDLSIDGDIIRKDGFDVIELPSGCICCSLRASLPEAVDMIFEKIKPEVLLIEPSGIATPSNILDAIKSCRHVREYRIKPVICIVDASSFHDFFGDFGKFYIDQIKTADMILINKIDLVESEKVDEIERELMRINYHAIVLRSEYCKNIAENVGERLETDYKSSESELILESTSFIPQKKFTADELERIIRDIAGGKFGNVIRGKGFVECDGLCMFQISGENFEIKKIEESVKPKAVFIGDRLKTEKIKRLFGV